MKDTDKQSLKPLIISRVPPHLGGREIVIQSIVDHFKTSSSVCVLSPDVKSKEGFAINSNLSIGSILTWAKKQKPNIINCHTFYLADLAVFLSKKLKIPLIFTLHGVFVDYYDEKYKKIIQYIYKNSDRVNTVSDDYNRRLRSFLSSYEILTIKNGIDLHKIKNIRKNILHYLPKDKFIVVTPARLTAFKGLEYLIGAANEMDDRFYFVIASPAGRASKEEMVYKIKLKKKLISKNVVFKEFSNKGLLNLYLNSDMVVLPSLLEGISISILEAMASGIVVAATNVGGNKEIIKNNLNGFLIKSKNRKSIENIIKKVYHIKKANKIKITDRAKKSISEKFDSRRMFQEYEDLFHKIIKNYDRKY